MAGNSQETEGFPALRQSGFEWNELSGLAKVKIHDQLIHCDQVIKCLSGQKSPMSHEEEKQECFKFWLSGIKKNRLFHVFCGSCRPSPSVPAWDSKASLR